MSYHKLFLFYGCFMVHSMICMSGQLGVTTSGMMHDHGDPTDDFAPGGASTLFDPELPIAGR